MIYKVIYPGFPGCGNDFSANFKLIRGNIGANMIHPVDSSQRLLEDSFIADVTRNCLLGTFSQQLSCLILPVGEHANMGMFLNQAAENRSSRFPGRSC